VFCESFVCPAENLSDLFAEAIRSDPEMDIRSTYVEIFDKNIA